MKVLKKHKSPPIKDAQKMNINIANLGLQEFFLRKSDIIYGLYHALSSLGHDVTVSHNELNGKRLNLIIGSDIISGDNSAIKQLLVPNIDYAIYEVENFNGHTINYRDNFPIQNYVDLLLGSKFVITPYAHNMPALRKICGDDSTRYARWGFHESMVNNNINRTDTFEFDAMFFGLIKGSRRQKIELLKTHFLTRLKIIDERDPYTIRDYAVSKSRFGLSLSYGATDDFVNPFRLFHMAANKMPILADNVKDEDGYLSICEKVDSTQMVEMISKRNVNNALLFEKCIENNLAENLKEVL